MIIIKYLLSSILATAPLPMDEKGWVTLDHSKTSEQNHFYEDVDPSIWVVFSKQMGPEKILLSFPEDPEYHYFDGPGDELEAVAKEKGAEYRLQVLKKKFESEEEILLFRKEVLGEVALISAETKAETEKILAEITYWKEGYWYFERWISTPHHSYLLQVKSNSLEDASPKLFADSFDLEIAKK